jgi:hypothetical protein
MTRATRRTEAAGTHKLDDSLLGVVDLSRRAWIISCLSSLPFMHWRAAFAHRLEDGLDASLQVSDQLVDLADAQAGHAQLLSAVLI